MSFNNLSDSEVTQLLKAIRAYRRNRIKSTEKLERKFKERGERLDKSLFQKDMIIQKSLIDVLDKELISRGITRIEDDHGA